MEISSDKYHLLLDKTILQILEGDEIFGMEELEGIGRKIQISMPYLSGPVLCGISCRFGLPVMYSDSALSRWMYLENLIKHCIGRRQVPKLLNFLFSKGQFKDKLRGLPSDVIDKVHSYLVQVVIQHINDYLSLGGYELVRLDEDFLIQEIGVRPLVTTPTMKTIDRAYIVDLSNRALKDVSEGSYDSAITKSRTLLEEVFCYVLEMKNEEPSSKGDIGKLFNQVKAVYNMRQTKDLDQRINSLISGLEKILSAIAEMRNRASDAHGVGLKRINIQDYHARLFVNLAQSMAEFILSVSKNTECQ